MNEYVSAKYRATVRDDGLLTVTNGPPVLHVVHFAPDGIASEKFVTRETATTQADRDLLAAKAGAPVFLACRAEGKDWNVDIDCGMQRFNGVKSISQLRTALKNCGFSKAQIDGMLKLCRKAPKWDYCPRGER